MKRIIYILFLFLLWDMVGAGLPRLYCQEKEPLKAIDVSGQAVGADMGASLLVIFNGLRLLRYSA